MSIAAVEQLQKECAKYELQALEAQEEVEKGTDSFGHLPLCTVLNLRMPSSVKKLTQELEKENENLRKIVETLHASKAATADSAAQTSFTRVAGRETAVQCDHAEFDACLNCARKAESYENTVRVLNEKIESQAQIIEQMSKAKGVTVDDIEIQGKAQ